MTVATLGQSFHDAFSWIERWVSAATLVDWILLGVGVVVLLVAWRVLNAPARLGPIEVSAGEGEATGATFGRNEIAAMRRELAQWGIVPAAGVPAGSPTASIAAAVEASPLQYGKFVGEVIKLIPIPAGAVGFKVTATVEKNGDAGPHTLTYHLTRTDTGETLGLDSGEPAKMLNDAIVAAAGEIFRKIAASAEGIFPPWSQWPDGVGMMQYRDALDCERKGQWEEATDRFADAARAAPDNMLPRLRRANCLERRAGRASGPEKARLRIHALELYRAIATREPHIFEAHYRASLLLSALADGLPKNGAAAEEVDTIDTVDEAGQRALAALANLPERDSLEEQLRALAQEEASAARHELSAYATLLREGRLRNRLEPRGRERRQTLRALRISRLALNVRRQWSPGQPVPETLGELRRYWWRFQVRRNLLRPGWQAHYNAACFYAVLPEVCGPDTYRALDRKVLRKRAFRHLRQALRDPQNEIDCDYVRDGDTDLRALRKSAEWDEIMCAFCPHEALVHYVRRQHDYTGWRLRVSGSGVDPSVDDATLGAELNGAKQATYRVPLRRLSQEVRVVLINGERKDLEQHDRYFTPRETSPCMIWIYEGEAAIHLAPKALGVSLRRGARTRAPHAC